jgi:CHAT domain-containing protein
VALVNKLRCGLDGRAWLQEDAARSCAKLLGKEAEEGAPLPFDLEASHRLYELLFGPVASLIEDKHLFVVPASTIGSLPLQVLVTKPPTQKASDPSYYRDVAWLGTRQPITILPSVQALRAARLDKAVRPQKLPFIGFGNPLLSGDLAGATKMVADTAHCAEPTDLPHKPKVQLAALPVIGPLRRGQFADLKEINALPPLPETVGELCTIASALGASADNVWIGSRATEANLKALSASGELARYRVVQFATHGLVPGDLVKLREPALVLTSPETSSEADDSLLTTAEVAELKLDADLVILSACNTAAPGSNSAEALSGLARSFLFAGARSVLVSHWEVYSDAAVKLTTQAIAETVTDHTIDLAEAMRRSMTNLVRNGKAYETHPSYWAPFVLVGLPQASN